MQGVSSIDQLLKSMKHHHLPDAILKKEVFYTLSPAQGSPQWKDEGTESHFKTVQQDTSSLCSGKEVGPKPLRTPPLIDNVSLYSPSLETNEKRAVISHSKCLPKNSEATAGTGSNLPTLTVTHEGQCKSLVIGLTSSKELRALKPSGRLLNSVDVINNDLVLSTGSMMWEPEESRTWSSPKRNEDDEDDDFIPVGTLQVSSIKRSNNSEPGAAVHLVSPNLRIKSNGLQQDRNHASRYLHPRNRPDLIEDRLVLSQASRQQRAPQSHQRRGPSELSAADPPADPAARQPWACNNNHQHQPAMSSMSSDCTCQPLAVSSSDPIKVSPEHLQQSLDLCDLATLTRDVIHFPHIQNERELVDSKYQSKALGSSQLSSQIPTAHKNLSQTEPSDTILQSTQAIAPLTPANIFTENLLNTYHKHGRESKLSSSLYHSAISETETSSTAGDPLSHLSDLEQSLHLPSIRQSTHSIQAQAPSLSASVKLSGCTTQHSGSSMTDLHQLRNPQASCPKNKAQGSSSEGNGIRAPVKRKLEMLHTSWAHLEQLGNKIAVVELNCCDLPARLGSSYQRLERPDVKNSPNKKSHPLNKSFFRMHKKYRKRNMRGGYIKSTSSQRAATRAEDRRCTKDSSCIKTDCLKQNRTLTQSRSKSQNYRFCVPRKSTTKAASKTEDCHLKDKNSNSDLDGNKNPPVGNEHVLRSVKLVKALPSVTNRSLREHASSLKTTSSRLELGRNTSIKGTHAVLADDSKETQENRSNNKRRRLSSPSRVQQKCKFLTNKGDKGKQQDSALHNKIKQPRGGKSNKNKGNRKKSQQVKCYNLGFLRLRTALRSQSKRHYYKNQKASQNNRTTEYVTRRRSTQQASLDMCLPSSGPSIATQGSLSESVAQVDTSSLPMLSEGKVTRQRTIVNKNEPFDKNDSKRKILSKNTSKRHKPLRSKKARLTSKTKLRRAERMGTSSRCLKMAKRKSPCLSQQRMVTRKVVAELDKLKSSCAPDLKQSLLEFMNLLPDCDTSTDNKPVKTGSAPNANSCKSASNSERKINEKISYSSELTRSVLTKMLNIENKRIVESVIPDITAVELEHVNSSDEEINEVSDLQKMKNSTVHMSQAGIDVKMDSSCHSTKKRYSTSDSGGSGLSLQDGVVVISELDTVESEHFLKTNEKNLTDMASAENGKKEDFVGENIAESSRVEKCTAHIPKIENGEICAGENIFTIDDEISCTEFGITKTKIETVCMDEPMAVVNKITCMPDSESEKIVEGCIYPKMEKILDSIENLEDLNSKNDEKTEESLLDMVATIQPPYKSELATVSSCQMSFKSETGCQLSHFTPCDDNKTTLPMLSGDKPGMPCKKNLVMFKLVPVLDGGEPDYDLNSLIPVNGYFLPGSSSNHILLPQTFLHHFNTHEWSPKEKTTNSPPPASLAEQSSSISVAPLPQLNTGGVGPTFPERRPRAHSLTSTPIKTHSVLPELATTLGTWDMLPEATPSTDLPAHHSGLHLQHPPSTPSPSVGESSILAHRKIGPLEGLQMSPSPSWNSTTPSSSPLLLSSSSLSAWNISSPMSSNQLLHKQQLPSLRTGQDLVSPPVSSSVARSGGQDLQASLDMYNPNPKPSSQYKSVEPTPSKHYVSKQSILDSMAYDLNKYGNCAYSAGQSDFMEKLNDVTQTNAATVDWKLSDARSSSHCSDMPEHARYPSGQVPQNITQDNRVTPRTQGHTRYTSSSYSEASGCERKQEQVLAGYGNGQLGEEVGFTHTVNLDRSLPYMVSPTLQPRPGPANTPPVSTSTANETSYVNHHHQTSSIDFNTQPPVDKCGSFSTRVRDMTEEQGFDGKKKARRRKMQYECYTENNVKKCRCLICGKSLGAATIYRHLRTHDPDYKVCCHLCNKEYTQRQSLEMHLQRFHPDHLSQNHVSAQDPGSEEDLPSFDHSDGLPYQLRDIELDQHAQLLPEETLQQLVNEPRLLSSQSQQTATMLKRAGPGASVNTASDKSVAQNLPSGIGAAHGQSRTHGLRLQVTPVQSNKRPAEMVAELHNTKSSLASGSVTFNESLSKNGYAAKQQFEYIHDRVVHSDNLSETSSKGRQMSFMIAEESGRLTENNMEELSAIGLEEYDCKSREAVDSSAKSQSVLSPHNLLSPLADTPHSPGFVGNTSSCDSMEESSCADLTDQSQLESAAAKETGKYPCEICHAKLSSRNGYTIHKRRHSTVMTRFCKFCNKGFHTGQEVRSHERTHTGEKPYKCNICYAAFAHSGSCVSHKKGHKKRGETTPFPIVDGLIQYPPTFKVLKPQGSNSDHTGGPKKKKKSKKKPENLEKTNLENMKSHQNDSGTISQESSGLYGRNSECELSTLTASSNVAMQDQQDIRSHTTLSPQPGFQGPRGISQNQPSRLHMDLVDDILPHDPAAKQDGSKSQAYLPGQSFINADFGESSHRRNQADKVAAQHNFYSLESYLPGSASTSDYPTESLGSVSSLLLNTSTDSTQYFEGSATLDDIDSNDDFKNYMMPQQHMAATSYSQGLDDLGQQQTDCSFSMTTYKGDSSDAAQKQLQHYDFRPPPFLATGGRPSIMAVAECAQSRQTTLIPNNLPSYSSSLDNSPQMYYNYSADYKRTDSSSAATQKYSPVKLNTQLSSSHGYYQYQQSPSYFSGPDDYHNSEGQLRSSSGKSDGRYARTESYPDNQFVSPSFQASRYSYPQIQDGTLGQITAGTPQSLPTIDSFTRDSRKNAPSQYH